MAAYSVYLKPQVMAAYSVYLKPQVMAAYSVYLKPQVMAAYSVYLKPQVMAAYSVLHILEAYTSSDGSIYCIPSSKAELHAKLQKCVCYGRLNIP
jgi:hypothetical protein